MGGVCTWMRSDTPLDFSLSATCMRVLRHHVHFAAGCSRSGIATTGAATISRRAAHLPTNLLWLRHCEPAPWVLLLWRSRPSWPALSGLRRRVPAQWLMQTSRWVAATWLFGGPDESARLRVQWGKPDTSFAPPASPCSLLQLSAPPVDDEPTCRIATPGRRRTRRCARRMAAATTRQVTLASLGASTRRCLSRYVAATHGRVPIVE
jgi:hypothetical protein